MNPTLEAVSEETEADEEGCLSFPKLYADVTRPVGIRVAFQDLRGRPRKLELAGFPARLFQHEFDHLQGVLFVDRMDAANVAKIRPGLRELEAAGAARGWTVPAPH